MSFLDNKLINMKNKLNKKHKDHHTFQDEMKKFNIRHYKQDKI